MNLDDLKLLEDRMVVRVIKNLKSDVLDLSPAGEIPTRAEVLRVGPGLVDKKGRLQPMEVLPGELIRFFPRAGTDMLFKLRDGTEEKLRIIRQSDVLAILDPSDEQEEVTSGPS